VVLEAAHLMAAISSSTTKGGRSARRSRWTRRDPARLAAGSDPALHRLSVDTTLKQQGPRIRRLVGQEAANRQERRGAGASGTVGRGISIGQFPNGPAVCNRITSASSAV